MKLLEILRSTIRDTSEDRVLTHAAALAFYTALALPPILVVMVTVLNSMSPGAEVFLRTEAGALMGREGETLVESVLANASRVELSSLSGMLSSAALLFAASGVFAQLQLALNRIWGVRVRPGGGVRDWLRKRFLSLGLVGVLAFLMLVSLAASTLIGSLGLNEETALITRVINWVISIAIFTLLFAAVFRLLPDANIRWRDVCGGAFVTACLFSIGKWVIGVYLSRKGLGADYGAAGSAIVVLAWVYFSSAIVFVGAELTESWLQVSGRTIEPNKHAVRIRVQTIDPGTD